MRQRCMVCGWQPASRRGRCNACRLFLRRHGRDKTPGEIMRGYERTLDRLDRLLDA